MQLLTPTGATLSQFLEFAGVLLGKPGTVGNWQQAGCGLQKTGCQGYDPLGLAPSTGANGSVEVAGEIRRDIAAADKVTVDRVGGGTTAVAAVGEGAVEVGAVEAGAVEAEGIGESVGVVAQPPGE